MIIDFTHTICEEMPVYPGTAPCRLQVVCTHGEAGFQETELVVWSHMGTHMDSPLHIFPGKASLDMLPVSQFIGKGLVLDCRGKSSVTLEAVMQMEPLLGEAEFLLLHSGWDTHWGSEKYFSDYPCLTKEAAEYLASSGKKGVGIDAISVDRVEDGDLPIHRILLESGLVIIENLTKLGAANEGLFTFCALPLKYLNADGGPVRAIAMG